MKTILDACCSGRMFWFNRNHPRAIYMDIRRESHPMDKGTPGTKGRSVFVVDPDIIADFADMPFPDCSFSLVVFDPPHLIKMGETSTLSQKYGRLIVGWQDKIQKGFSECFRVLKPEGVLVFKWCEHDIPLSEILALTEQTPLFGQRGGRRDKTHWLVFQKE